MNSQLISLRTAPWVSALLALAGMHCAFAQEPVVDPGDAGGRVARLSYVEGGVSIAPAGARSETILPEANSREGNSEAWTDAVLNRPLVSGDELWLDGGGRAELQLDSASIHLDHDTSFGFIQLDDDLVEMSLTDGAATINVQRLGERETVRIETPNASVFLRHPGEYHVRVDTAAEVTIVGTRSGEAEVVGGSSSHRSYTVGANEQGIFSGLEDLTAQIDPLGPRTAFESWANDRQRLAESSQSSHYVSEDVIGYEDLDENGEWIYEPGYGHVWTPLYVRSDWAPYRYGRWARISPWGWTWIDDARWGFAPFHYGSWARVRNRWCWVPGPRHPRHVRPDRPVFTTPDRDHVLGGHTRLPPLRGNADFFGENPKRGGDFRTARPRTVTSEIKRAEQATPARSRMTPARSRIEPSRDRLEIMRAAESRTRTHSSSSSSRLESRGSSIQTLRAAPAARPHTTLAPSRSRIQPRAAQPRSQPRAHVERAPAPRAVHRSSGAAERSSRPHSGSRGPKLRTQKK